MIDKRLIEPVNYSTTQKFLKRYIKVTILRVQMFDISADLPMQKPPQKIVPANNYT